MNRLKKETFGNGDYISYEYDSSGNITQKIKYERRDAVLDEYTVLKRTVEKYTYAPEEGNRLQKVKFTVYNDKKLLQKDWVQASGEREYEYDGQGNYVGVTINTSNIGYKQTGYYCKWANGNRLTEVAVGTANKVRSRYTYNAEGIRVGKELIGFNSTTGEPINININMQHKYYLAGTRILAEDHITNIGGTPATVRLEFYYDSTGVRGFKGLWGKYYYLKNLQGDIIKVIGEDGKVYAEYEYSAYGECTIKTNVSNVATLNPFRYRGYYYDSETGLYYLNTRWYDPETGRFISPDSVDYLDPESINGLNLYAYCLNNPVMGYDPDGTLDWWQKLLIGLAFIVVGAVVTAATAGTGTGFVAAFGSALLSSATQVGISTGISAIIGGAISAIEGNGFMDGFTDGLVDGFMWGGIFSGGAQTVGGFFRGVANMGVTTGRKGGFMLGNTGIRILSPDKNSWAKAGGTIIKFGKFLRFDIGAHWGFHMHILKSPHIPIGSILAGIIGGF